MCDPFTELGIKDFFNQQTNWIVILMPLAMVMDFVAKAVVCVHLNIITKRTAPFMDVSLNMQTFKA